MHRTCILQCKSAYLAFPREPLHRFLDLPSQEFIYEQLGKVIPATAELRVSITPTEELGVRRIFRQGVVSPEKIFCKPPPLAAF
jgi:hypothetical protein